MRILLAFRAFFRTLFNRNTAEKVQLALEGSRPAATASDAAPQSKPVTPLPPAKPARSEALNLLAALQREGRLVDFLQESLVGFSDAQVGAVARDIHRDCGKVLARIFEIHPAVDRKEGEAIELPEGFDAGRYKLVGNVTGAAPFRGQLLHGGWEAARCEVPSWTGGESTRLVIAPAEVELK